MAVPSSPLGAAGSALGGSSGVPKKKEPEIVVIPEKFYGMALKLDAAAPAPAEQKPLPPPPPKPKPVPKPAPVMLKEPVHHSHWVLILGLLLLFLAIGGGFVYLNRDLLFKKSPTVPTPPPVVQVPVNPSNLTAAPSGNAIALSWVDAATDETGYRIERKQDDGSFLPLTTLPANTNAFLDVSVQPGQTYVYHVIAVNDGGESGASNDAQVVATAAPPPTVNPALPPGGLDSDSDGLSDVEEPLYGTDPHNPDSDSDGFLDGNEVYHLYNPAAKAPIRLLDSGLVHLFSSPAGWSLYVPATWTSALDAPDGSAATVDTGHGEKFSISLLNNADHTPLSDWYLGQHPDAATSTVRSFMTKGGLEGLLSPDRLEAYFAWDGKVFELRYDLSGQPFVNFRTTFEMMLNSLKLVGAPVVEAPSDQALGGPGALSGVATTSSAESPATSVSAGVTTSSAPEATSTPASSTNP